MNALLFNRSLGALDPRIFERTETTRLLHALQPSSDRFTTSSGLSQDGTDGNAVAHPAGVNSIAIDKFEGKYLLSGGADSSITLWDLEAPLPSSNPSTPFTHTPLGSVARTSTSHRYGITHVAFYPFDSLAFLTSSYDYTLKLFSSTTLTASATFDLASVVYSHALSPIAHHLLVACATQHPAIRLVDLKSGAAAHALPGHAGAVLSVAWSPVDEHVLASAGTDGTVRFWDVRRSAGQLGMLDMDDSVGVAGFAKGIGVSATRPRPAQGKAHTGPCNGLVWTEDGRHIVSTGHDERMRVWNVKRGANTLANFGPLVRNVYSTTLLPVIAPVTLVDEGKELVFTPSEKEILAFELFEGRLLKRLRPASAAREPLDSLAPPARSGSDVSTMPVSNAPKAQRNLRNRTTALAWRAHSVELYSAHSNGRVLAWKPRTAEDAEADEDEGVEGMEADEERKRKRKALEDVYRDLSRKRMIVE